MLTPRDLGVPYPSMKLNRFLLLVLITGLAGNAPATHQPSAATMTTQRFEFVSNGNRLSGFVDVPAGGTARAMIVIIPGYGKTDVAGRTSYYDLRSRFTQLGISTLIWDKPGCGESKGTFDADQPVESSAREVLDAIQHARENKLPGSQKVGLWGISRAGWIAPLAITQDPKIAFWISVSGTDDKENFPYLLESNLRIDGRTEAEIKLLLGEWRHGFEIMSRGGTFEDYLAATQTLRQDPFMVFLSGGKDEDKAAFLAEQKQFLSGTKKGPGYFIAEVEVTDPATMQKYGQQVPATLAPFNYRYLVRSRNIQTLEGEPPKGGIVMIQFDSVEKAREWYDSPAYAAIRPIQQQAAKSRVFIVQGEP